jgi:hypothetical protein
VEARAEGLFVISCKSDTVPIRGWTQHSHQGKRQADFGHPTLSRFAENSSWPPLAVRLSESLLDVLAVLAVVVVVCVWVSWALTTKRTRAMRGVEAATALTEAARRCIIAETGIVAGFGLGPGKKVFVA